ncbi:MAG TPA: hypothetical protein VJ648_00685 [Vicinamibacteria bacterium]|nr:hypothetical protein [Vicinamibacteria bacterium]
MGALALLAAAWFSPRVVPYNMDEFVHYHALGCATAADAQALPSIRDGCGYFDLRLPFTTTPLPLRAYYYIGSIPALPFYPFWRLVDDPVAARLAGACWFLVSTLLAGRLLGVGASSILTASLVFPVWLGTFLVDEGPVALSVVLLLSAFLAERRALQAPASGASAVWAAAAGLALFLGLWTKLVFAWWLPTVAIFVLEEARRQGQSLAAAARSRLPALVAGAAFLAVPTTLLLASVDRDGQPYAAALRQGGLSTEPEDVEAVALRLVRYVVDGSLVAPRNLLLPASRLDVLPLLLSAVLLVLGWRRAASRRAMATWAILSALTFAFVAASGHSRWPHHFAFPLLPLVLALALACEGLARRERLATFALVAVFWATLGARLPEARTPAESSVDKDRLLAFVRDRGLDRESLQVHASWGTYYIAQLFGDPARMVVYARRVVDDPARLSQMAELARATGRPVLLLSSRRFERLHTPAVEAAFGRPQHTWQFGSWWAVEYHPPPRD